MCGIVGFHARESVPTTNDFDILFTEAEKRGIDGVGIAIYKPSLKEFQIFKHHKSYSSIKDIVLEFIDTHLEIGDILIGICRAIPETEVKTDKSNLDLTMQPIFYPDEKLALVHNGAISEITRLYLEKKGYKQRTKIDSERILLSYLANKKRIPDFLTYVIGGFAFLLIDGVQDRLIIGVNHMPLSEGYVKGIGYFIHSYSQPILSIIQKHYSTNKCGLNEWESWYVNEVSSYYVKSIDLHSGMVMGKKFQQNYFVNNKILYDPEKIF